MVQKTHGTWFVPGKDYNDSSNNKYNVKEGLKKQINKEKQIDNKKLDLFLNIFALRN